MDSRSSTVNRRRRPSCVRGEILAIVLVLSVSLIGGAIRLSGWHGTQASVSNDLFIPSLLYASGKGFVNCDPSGIPGLREFLDYRSPTFDGTSIPSGLKTIPFDSFERYHQYLLTLVGAAWRLGGISWDVMHLLLVGILGLTALLFYGVFRLGMGRFASAAGAILALSCPVIMNTLPYIRDFGKTPFLLGVILILGLLIRRPRKTWGLFAGAMALGVIEGIGLGFRRDLLMCVAPSLVVVMMVRLHPPGWRIGSRISAGIVLLCFFLLSGLPILRAFHEHGTLGWHDVLMGMATTCDDKMNIDRASYERMYLGDDMLVHRAGLWYAYPDMPYHGPSYVMQTDNERKLLTDTIFTFPGDMITRGYAACLKILSGTLFFEDSGDCENPSAGHSPAEYRNAFPLLCAAAALLMIASGDLWMGFLVLFVVLYFGGVPSLQFQPRHTTHLVFLPLWVMGFVLSKMIGTAWTFRRADTRRRAMRRLACRQEWVSRARRLFCFLIPALLALFVPLYAARAWQHATVNRLMAAYQSAQCDSVETQPVSLGDQDATLFRAKGEVAPGPEAFMEQNTYTIHRCWVAEFELGSAPICFWIRYESQNAAPDFSQAIVVDVPAAAQGKVRHFFPVYEGNFGNGWARFAGVALRNEDAPRFRGLYRTRDWRSLPMRLNMSIGEDPTAFRWRQGLDWPRTCTYPGGLTWTFRPEPRDLVQAARDDRLKQDFQGAVRQCETALAMDPRNLMLIDELARSFEDQRNAEAAIEVYKRGIRANPEDGMACRMLDEYFNRSGNREGRVAAWRAIAEEDPSLRRPPFHLGEALEAVDDHKGAEDAFRMALQRNPGHPAVCKALGRVLLRTGKATEAAQLFREGLSAAPNDTVFYAWRAEALAEAGARGRGVAGLS